VPAVQRVGDQNNAGGVILNGDSSVLVNGRAIAIQGASVSAHPCCGQRGCPPTHCSATTTAKTTNVFVNGKAIMYADKITNSIINAQPGFERRIKYTFPSH
jgi:uncharacterized Zn-binding protein involved in type VI secretion